MPGTLDELKRIPIIKREDDISKNCKMIYIVIIIIMIGVFILHYKVDDKNNIYNLTRCDIDTNGCISIENHGDKYNTEPKLGKYIQIRNLNKQVLPIKKIVVIDHKRQVYPLFPQHTKTVFINDGMVVTYALPHEILISQIVIDMDMTSQHVRNIVTSKISIINAERCVTWIYKKPLRLERHITVYVVEPHIVYPYINEHIDTRLPEEEQEFILSQKL